MRFLHTADWHLGRSLGGFSLLRDQEFLLSGQFLGIVRDTRPDAVLIAGDVFDRSVPPADAVELLDDLLVRLIRECAVPVILIPGNHDEARRLGFGAKLLTASGLHIGQSAMGEAIRIVSARGAATVVTSGYASPALLATLPGLEAVACHDSGFAALAPRLHALCAESGPRLLVAHAFVAGGAESRDSERGLAVGGSGAVAPDRFAGFDYVALGHLHRPQTLAGGRVRYSGSPLPYSVAEADHAKSVTLVELDRGGGIPRVEEFALTPLRAVRVLTGAFATLLRSPPEGRLDFVAVRLTDATPVPDAQRRLAAVFPHLVGIDYVAAERAASAGVAAASAAVRAARPFELFAAFHAAMRDGATLSDAEGAVVASAIANAEAAGG